MVSDHSQSITWGDVRVRLRMEKGPPLAAAATWYCYRFAIDLLEAACPVPRQVDTPCIIAIRQDLEARGRRPATVRSRLSFVRAVCHWLLDEGHIERSPFRRRCQLLPRLRKRDSQKFAFSPDQIAAVLTQADEELAAADLRLAWQPDRIVAQHERYRAARLRALLYLVAYTGLRATEALYLRCADVRADGRTVTVTGEDRPTKTVDSVGEVPVPGEGAAVLAAWRDEQVARGRRFLFSQVIADRVWHQTARESRATVRARRLAERAGVNGLTLQLLRHTFTSCVKVYGGLNREEARQILRHTSTRTQETYTHEDLGHLVRAVEGFSYRRAE